MNRTLLLMLMLISALTVSAQQYYGKVNDPDGYTNIRKGPGTNYAIARRYQSGDYLYYTPQNNGWSKVYSGEKKQHFYGLYAY